MLKLLGNVCCLFLLGSSTLFLSANAADYLNTDLSAPVLSVADYDNVTILNERSLTSGDVTGGYVFLGGSVSGNVDINNSSDGSITSTHNNYGVFYLPSVGDTSSLKTIAITNTGDLVTTGEFAHTVYILGNIDEGTRRSYDFLLNNDGNINSAAGGVYITNAASGSSTITNTGIISTIATSVVKAISLTGGATSTITNTGTIQANAADEGAIEVDATHSTITNSGSGSITGIINAAGNSSSSLTITNNTTASITGNITTSNSDLDVINNAGTITGNITLGNHASSSLTMNGGTVAGNVTMDNTTQTVTFGGGVLEGTIDGAGQIIVNSNSITDGNIGATTSLTRLTIGASKTLNAFTNNNSVRATTISLDSGSVLSMGSGALVGTVDGNGVNKGTVNLTFDSNADLTSTLGSINGLAAVNIALVDGAVVTATTSIKAAEVNVSGIDGALILDPAIGITGNVVIGDRSNLLLGDESFVTGIIRSNVNRSGGFQLDSNSHFTAGGDIGTTSFYVGSIDILDNSTFTTSHALRSNILSLGSDATLTSSSAILGDIQLGVDAVLNLQDGATMNGAIDPGGIVEEGIVNTQGNVTILGTIGNGGPIAEINVGSGSRLSLGNNDNSGANSIDALNVNVIGQLNLINETTMHGNVTMLGSSSKINLSEHSHTIDGNFTTASGSRLYSTIHSATAIDHLNITGGAILDANTKLSLAVGRVMPGESYTLIFGGEGSALSAITASNIDVDGRGINRVGRYIFTTEVSGNDLILNTSLVPLLTPPNRNQSDIYNSIINVDAANGGELYEMQEYLYGTASDSAKNEALNSVLPQIDNASNTVIFNNASSVLNLSSSRLLNLYNLDAAPNVQTSYNFYQENPFNKFDMNPYSLFEPASSYYNEYYTTNYSNSIWSQIFGSHINQGSNSIADGYNANTRGIVFGFDTKVNKNLYIGISGSYANSHIKSHNLLKKNDIDSYQVNLYSGLDLEQYFMNGLIGFSQNEYESERIIPVTGNVAQAQYSGQNYIARMEVGSNLKLPYHYMITPLATVTAACNSIEDYSENGAGSLSLYTTASEAELFETRAGIILKNSFTLNNITIHPEILASYGYDFAASQQRNTSHFIGQNTNFDTVSNNPSRASFKTGFGGRIFEKEAFIFDLNYIFEKRPNYSANSAGLKVTYRF